MQCIINPHDTLAQIAWWSHISEDRHLMKIDMASVTFSTGGHLCITWQSSFQMHPKNIPELIRNSSTMQTDSYKFNNALLHCYRDSAKMASRGKRLYMAENISHKPLHRPMLIYHEGEHQEYIQNMIYHWCSSHLHLIQWRSPGSTLLWAKQHFVASWNVFWCQSTSVHSLCFNSKENTIKNMI